jgi:hypothetical protein
MLIVSNGNRFELVLKRALKATSPMVISDFAYG